MLGAMPFVVEALLWTAIAVSAVFVMYLLELQRFGGHFLTLGDPHLLGELGSLVVRRTHVANRGVPPNRIVEAFYVIEGCRPRRFFPAGEHRSAHFGFQRRDERFGHGVIEGRAHPAHRREDTRFLETLSEGERRILRSPVGVVDHP